MNVEKENEHKTGVKWKMFSLHPTIFHTKQRTKGECFSGKRTFVYVDKNCMTFCWIKTLKEIHLTNELKFYAF